jgi:hypothetical protein
MTEPKIKEEWARFIIGQALLEIRSAKDIPKVRDKVLGTAVGTRPDLMRHFDELAELKKKMLKSRMGV